MTTFDAHVHVIAPELTRGAEPVGRLWQRRPPTSSSPSRHPIATLRATGLDEETPAAVLRGNGGRELWRVPVTGEHRG